MGDSHTHLDSFRMPQESTKKNADSIGNSGTHQKQAQTQTQTRTKQIRKIMDPRVGAPNISDNDNNAVATAATAATADVADVAVGNHNSSSQNEHNETTSRGSLGSAPVSVSTIFRLPSSEWLEDIDTETLLGCGAYKCAFPSRTTSRGNDSSSSGSNDPYRLRYGYLVTNKFGLEKLERAFALAQELSETFAVKHTMLANPLAFGEGEANKSFFVQPIKLYSKQSFIFKCNSNLRHNYEPLEWAKKLQLHSALVDPIVFQERLQLDHNRTTEMMMYSNHSQCLAQDFQLVIDSITGSIFHIDIDRCFQKIRKSFKIKPKNVMNITDCMQELETITESMIARKKYLYLTIDSAGSNHQNKMVAMTKIKTNFEVMGRHKRDELADLIDMARNCGN